MTTLPSSDAREKFQVVLVDDHSIVRHALRTILEEDGGYEVIGEAATCEQTLEILSKSEPDFVILDLALPGKSGFETLIETKKRGLVGEVVILTMYEDDAKVVQCITAGAKAYLNKNASSGEFLRALEVVRSGETYLPVRFKHLEREIASGKSSLSSTDNGDPLSKLSKREREVFYLLAEGMPNRVIAKRLFISPRTVETHRARVIKKLGFSSTADLIRYAIRNNLLTL